jgi:pimeloyl-ACP methyl ester carboxylesterase
VNKAVEPFQVPVDADSLHDLVGRLRRTRWPDRELTMDWSQGVPLQYLRDLCDYWAEEYDWTARAARMNRFPHFRTVIDGLGVHFIHVRSRHPGAMPLILTHGWPGSFSDFIDVIEPLVDPASFGGDPADAFHVVCPSLPGYGFSDKPTGLGWDHERIAGAWATLMNRLGYNRYAAQGGDWGAAVTTALAVIDPSHVIGIHLTSVRGRPTGEDLQDVTEREQEALDDVDRYTRWDSAYLRLQATRPQTVGYGLVDSPVAQCAWILEKIWSWTDTGADPVAVLGADRILDNVMLYWLPATGASSARLYWEGVDRLSDSTATIDTPTGVSLFAKDIYRPSRRWAQRIYTDIRYWNELPVGGHFAALEQPTLFVDELRSFFGLLRAGEVNPIPHQDGTT